MAVLSGTGHNIRFNSISLNTGLGIDLGDDGITPNDFLDLDTGPNNLQNYPVLTSASLVNGSISVAGTLQSTPLAFFFLDFYGSDVPSASEAEGEKYLGSTTVMTDASGNASFSLVLPDAFGTFLTATATDMAGNTSEFSAAVPITTATASIGDFVWHDLDGDGIQDAGEPGLTNVFVSLHNPDGTIVTSTFSGTSGFYQFGSLNPGNYYLSFSKPSGYSFSPQDQGSDDALDSDVNSLGQTAIFTLAAGQNDSTRDSGLVSQVGGTGSIGDFVWHDVDGDGIQDAGEPGLTNVFVSLHNPDGTIVTSTFSGTSGFYQFGSLNPGNYYLSFSKPSGYSFSPQDQGSDDALDSDVNSLGQTAVFSLSAGQAITSLDAGLMTEPGGTSYVAGRAWQDGDGDGIQDIGEFGIAGILVSLYKADGTPVASTMTTVGGLYSFGPVAPGSYFITFTLPPSGGFTFSPKDQGSDDTLDSDVGLDGLTDVFTLAAWENRNGIDAGLVPDGG